MGYDDIPRKGEVKPPKPEEKSAGALRRERARFFWGTFLPLLIWVLIVIFIFAFYWGFVYQQAGDMWDAGKRLGELI